MTTQLLFTPQTALSNGVFAPGAQVVFQLSGTTTEVTVYTDPDFAVPHPTPVVADAVGEFPQIFYNGTDEIKAVITTSEGEAIATIDPVARVNSASFTASELVFTPTEGNPATTVEGAINNNSTKLAPIKPGNAGRAVRVNDTGSALATYENGQDVLQVVDASLLSDPSAITFTNLNLNLYGSFEIELHNLIYGANGAGMSVLLSDDNGATFDNASGDYEYFADSRVSGSLTQTNTGNQNATGIEVNIDPGDQGVSGFIKLVSPESTSGSVVDFNVASVDVASEQVIKLTGAGRRKNPGAITALRIDTVFLADTFTSGRVILKGNRRLGTGVNSAPIQPASDFGLFIQSFASLATITDDQIPVGGYVQDLSTGAAYRRVASGADLDYSGSGGLLFDVVVSNGLFSASHLGIVGDGSDEGAMLNKCIEVSARTKARCDMSGLNISTGETITMLGGAHLFANEFSGTITLLSGSNVDIIKSENFDALDGITDPDNALWPADFSLIGIVIQGNYQNSDRTAYLNTSGHGVQIRSRKYAVNLRIYNVAGIGMFSEAASGNGATPLVPGYSPRADVKLYIHSTKEEGLIWNGPGDIVADDIFQTDAGSRIAADEFDGKVSSPTYGATNGGQTDGIVIDKGFEVSFIHTWGNYAGCGLVQNDGRLHCTGMIMSESNHFGGIKLLGGYGAISQIEIHRTGGLNDDDTPDFIHDSAGSSNRGHSIGQLYSTNTSQIAGRDGHSVMQLGANSRFLNVSQYSISNGEAAGHGVEIEAGAALYQLRGGLIHGCSGTANDTLASSAIYRKTTGAGRIEAQVIDCDVVLRSTGTPAVETLDIRYEVDTGDLPFAGDARLNDGQDWKIRGTVNGVYAGSERQMAFTFDSTVAGVQSVTLPHRLITAPWFAGIDGLAVVDNFSNISPSAGWRAMVADYDATNITVEFEMDTPQGANTSPRVNLRASV